MKKLIACLLIGAAVFSCKDENDVAPQKGSLSFGFDDKNSSNGRTSETETPKTIMISVKKSDGSYLFEDKVIRLYNFGPSFTSESLDFEVGTYTLTKLWVLNADGKVIAVTPVTGSSNANLVSHPLPINFSIVANQSTQVSCEVVKVVQDATKYGYGGFGVEFVEDATHDIKINFLASTNPNMQTHGYDSVVVTFTNGSTVVSKKLNVISPVQAVGKINSTELNGTSNCLMCWTIKVSAYYESIDEVLYNLHINEAVTTTTAYVTEPTRGIKIDGGKLMLLDKADAVYSSQNIAWENWAHLSDNYGNFKFTVKNDICYPIVKYSILKDGIDYLYFEKSIWSTDIGGADFKSYGSKYADFSDGISKGVYGDNTTFADFCPSDVTGRIVSGNFYFYTPGSDCYLVWMYENTPIDPDGSASPKFKVVPVDGKTPGSGRKRSGK